MTEFLQIVGVGLAAFVSTSFDNLGVLLAFFGVRGGRPRAVCAGYLVATCGVAVAAWAGARLVGSLPAERLGYFGVIPIALGLRGAWQLRGPQSSARGAPPKQTGSLPIALVTLAQSADNLAVYVSLFADCRDSLRLGLFAVLVVAAASWCALGFWLARRSPLARPLQRRVRFVLPVLLIAVGVFLLSDTAIDALT